jgi:hypothetical protein
LGMRMDLFKECNNAFVRTEKETRVQEVEDYIAERNIGPGRSVLGPRSMLLMEE